MRLRTLPWWSPLQSTSNLRNPLSTSTGEPGRRRAWVTKLFCHQTLWLDEKVITSFETAFDDELKFRETLEIKAVQKLELGGC